MVSLYKELLGLPAISNFAIRSPSYGRGNFLAVIPLGLDVWMRLNLVWFSERFQSLKSFHGFTRYQGFYLVKLTEPEAAQNSLRHRKDDLYRSISMMAYVHEGIQYTGTAFATHLDNVTVMRFTANVSPAISFNTRHLWITPYVYGVTSIQRCIGRLATTAGSWKSYKPYKELLETHVVDHSSSFDRFYRGRTDNLARNAISTTYLLTDQGGFLLSGPDGDQGLFALKTEHSNLHGIWNSELSSNWGCATPAVISKMVLKEFANIARKSTLKINQELAQAGSQCHSTSLKSLIRSGSDHRTGNVEKSLAREIYDMLHNTDIWRDSGQVDAAFCGF
ncbi:hypothetical protein EDD85DRAFT_790155 [Armillaria nabsnona]|nr:hypothetical protein EDD85DRAFT_790155 [Armillaria nabsnona]